MESNFKNNTHELIYETEIDSQIKKNLMVTKGETWWGAQNKLGAWCQRAHRNPVYSIGKYTQYSVITYVGKESENE